MVFARRPVILPSASNAISAWVTWSRPWQSVRKASERSEFHFTGRFTLRDAHSRYVLRCDALATKDGAATRHCFERAFAAYGLPERIRSDNGGPFAAPGLTRLSALSAWWIRLGIIPERIALGHPEQMPARHDGAPAEEEETGERSELHRRS